MLTTVGAIHRALFQISQARQAHQEALEIDRTLSSQRYTAHCFAELCADEAVAGKWEEAHRYAKQALIARDPHALIWVASPHWLETEALVRAGDVKEAQDDVQRYGARSERRRRCLITFLRACAVLEHMDGNKEQASRSLHKAAQLTEEIGLPGEQWRILTSLGELYEQRNMPEQAHETYARAAVTLTTLANSIQNETLRQNFLAVPQIRYVLQRYVE
jgi:tetratricopeptide (TPR) repeat protein